MLERFEKIEEETVGSQELFSGKEIPMMKKQEVDNIRVTDRLHVKDGVILQEKILDAKELEVKGFALEEQEAYAVVQVDEGQSVLIKTGLIPVMFKIETVPNENERTFFRLSGESITAIESSAQGNYSVGDELKRIQDFYDTDIDKSSSYKVVGFTREGKVLIQLESEEVIDRKPEDVALDFEKIEKEKNSEE